MASHLPGKQWHPWDVHYLLRRHDSSCWVGRLACHRHTGPSPCGFGRRSTYHCLRDAYSVKCIENQQLNQPLLEGLSLLLTIFARSAKFLATGSKTAQKLPTRRSHPLPATFARFARYLARLQPCIQKRSGCACAQQVPGHWIQSCPHVSSENAAAAAAVQVAMGHAASPHYFSPELET